MNYRRSPFLAIIMIALLVPLVASAGPREDVAHLVRALGYGGAIHQFKNYVMRSEPRYQELLEHLEDPDPDQDPDGEAG